MAQEGQALIDPEVMVAITLAEAEALRLEAEILAANMQPRHNLSFRDLSPLGQDAAPRPPQ